MTAESVVWTLLLHAVFLTLFLFLLCHCYSVWCPVSHGQGIASSLTFALLEVVACECCFGTIES